MDIPKAMVSIGGKPVLEHQIILAKRHGITDIYILSGYLAREIQEYFGDGADFGVNLTYLVDDFPCGTAGAVKSLENIFDERFMVFYGDTVMDVDLASFIHFDQELPSIASILVHPNDHPYDSDLIDINDDNIVTAFYTKPHAPIFYRNLVNAALYILSPKIFDYIPTSSLRPSDFGRDIFPTLVTLRQTIRAYKTPEYIKDMGTPDRLKQVTLDFLSGKVARLNKSHKRKAIFLDRDGVLNKELNNLYKIEDFQLLPGVGAAIRSINLSEYMALVVTNQPVIAKGLCTENELDTIHKKLETLLGGDRAYVDGIYYCPHHPQKGFEGERPDLKIECGCRKPMTGLISQALNDYNIELESSYLIGDRYVDILTGKNAGLKTILLRTGHGGSDKNEYNVEADEIFDNLNSAVDFILEEA
jgi:D,D-heptose 1,7-bisphosphate phosphatase